MTSPVRPPIAPMLAKLARVLPEGDWLYEPKWDGFRTIAFVEGGDVDLRSRNDKRLARYFPEITDALRELPVASAVLDGEIVVARERALDFAALMGRLHPSASRVARLSKEMPAAFIAFDVLAIEDEDLRGTPFSTRRARLEAVLESAPSPALLVTPQVREHALAASWLGRFNGGGIDGVVAKSPQLPYAAGKRTMFKVKHERSLECVVAGLRLLSSGPVVGSLLLGIYGDDGRLVHVGVASQLTDAARRDLARELRSFVTPLAGHPWEHGFGLERSPLGRLAGSAGRWSPGRNGAGLDPAPPRTRLRGGVHDNRRSPSPLSRTLHALAPGSRPSIVSLRPARFVDARPERADATRSSAVTPSEGRARRMSEATRSPLLDRRAVLGDRRDLVVGTITIPRAGSATIDVDGRAIALTNLDRVLYPETGFTKADLVAYALAIAPVSLPELADRPLTVGRFPSGIDGRGFAQSEIPGRPPWVRVMPLTLVGTGETKRFTLADERATLAWLAQMGVIELHSFLGRAADIERPVNLLFDLDPGAPAGLLEAARVAELVRDKLERLGLRARAKTSGSLGIHVLADVDGPTYGETRAVAVRIARDLAAEHPSLVVAEMDRAKRSGRVLIDARQNSARLTSITPWSLRTTVQPCVSTPVTWEELERARVPSDLIFGPAEALARAGLANEGRRSHTCSRETS